MNLRELDINEMPFWPAPFRFGALVLLIIICLGLAYHFLLSDEWNRYKQEQARETQLKQDYQVKYRTAVNLPVYRSQLAQLNEDLEVLLDMLPNDDETARLLDDITLVGTRSGLDFDRIEWLDAQPREFYTALPMRIDLQGEYHQIGEFVGQIAGLHRIISVKDFTLQRSDLTDDLQLNVTAETYRQQTLRAQP
ncbi:type 4a pilus biogenesis protein PilO [Pseudidiomarina terrestris]|uniref:Type 4a pilus biogenesis protein PilO n=1 Tax=Pseudidiomarina terrestris TaxID=2820060 RepID=A0AAW7QX97_9GAMM|nr:MULTISPECIES: type 4a pilus biogenesis protein PilO [unclassified Pseudidiomarina]MDN7124792.1 type 4a pilus biogenesis protein PilO [Pseudidiomarina sp. 1APP75-32.1]MDN7125849.1 type 4a pilus biogenesis protein PilO [Pseudidiomarina sp. 1APR75-33.1]MDN7129734.1 type 4a pilus biogenesis protein PilO [Pseudidiomarina sp. 1APR75-15]MDN7136481.1 type 4a pilus biogenesis protein PilO [Pseudidiomarina sp. 1ASP75-5]MDN7138008.1 type 4a pilus biogenesis protein PilO [Pseudidiomarina sp. 1ASP75-14]